MSMRYALTPSYTKGERLTLSSPIFSIGEKVKHLSFKKYGIIIKVFPSEAIKAECNRSTPYCEWQYYVQHSGWIWSVSEYALKSYQIKQDMKSDKKEHNNIH